MKRNMDIKNKEIEISEPRMVKSHDVILDAEYAEWIAEVKHRYRSAQVKAAVKVNGVVGYGIGKGHTALPCLPGRHGTTGHHQYHGRREQYGNWLYLHFKCKGSAR